MNTIDLTNLYKATEEDMLFGIGLLAEPGQPAAPMIQIFYSGWSREMLDIVRESLQAGVSLAITQTNGHTCDLHLATRERIALQTTAAGESEILRAPAWDAHLTNVEPDALAQFEAGRQRFGGFLLLMQSPEWEFVAAIDGTGQRAIVEEVRERRMPVPGTGP